MSTTAVTDVMIPFGQYPSWRGAGAHTEIDPGSFASPRLPGDGADTTAPEGGAGTINSPLESTWRLTPELEGMTEVYEFVLQTAREVAGDQIIVSPGRVVRHSEDDGEEWVQLGITITLKGSREGAARLRSALLPIVAERFGFDEISRLCLKITYRT